MDEDALNVTPQSPRIAQGPKQVRRPSRGRSHMLIDAKRTFSALLTVGLLVSSTARGGDSAGGPGADGQQLPRGMRQEAVRDPAMNMDAYFVVIPSDWRFEAAVIQGTGCAAQPFPMFRTVSPDGLTQLERLPRFDWQWGDSPYLPKRTPPNCLPLQEAVSGLEFLKRLSAVSNVQFVSEVPVPADALEAQKKNFARLNEMNAQMAARFHNAPAIQYGDLAQAKVRYRKGSVPMEALLTLTLSCIHRPFRDFRKRTFSVDDCSATVRVVRAAAAKLDEAAKRLQVAGARENPQWLQALQHRQSQALANQNQAALNQQLQAQNQQFQQSEALKLQQHQQFEQGQAARFQQSQQFNATLQRGTDMSMQRAQQNANAMHTAASDTVDYSLSQQTVRDPNTGQLSKVSAGHNNTWINDSRTHSLQTDDPNANPNGYVQGNWTQQQQVHGDGTSK